VHWGPGERRGGSKSVGGSWVGAGAMSVLCGGSLSFSIGGAERRERWGPGCPAAALVGGA